MIWKRQFIDIARRRKWSERKKRRWLILSMQDKAYEMTRTLPSGCRPRVDGPHKVRLATELLADLEDRFLPEHEKEDLEGLFNTTTQGANENIATWYFRIYDLQNCTARRAGIHLDVPDAEQLRLKFIEGLADPWIRTAVAARKPKTWHGCRRAAQEAEYDKADLLRYATDDPERAWRHQLSSNLPY